MIVKTKSSILKITNRNVCTKRKVVKSIVMQMLGHSLKLQVRRMIRWRSYRPNSLITMSWKRKFLTWEMPVNSKWHSWQIDWEKRKKNCLKLRWRLIYWKLKLQNLIRLQNSNLGNLVGRQLISSTECVLKYAMYILFKEHNSWKICITLTNSELILTKWRIRNLRATKWENSWLTTD